MLLQTDGERDPVQSHCNLFTYQDRLALVRTLGKWRNVAVNFLFRAFRMLLSNVKFKRFKPSHGEHFSFEVGQKSWAKVES